MPSEPAVDRDEFDHWRAIVEEKSRQLDHVTGELLPTIIGQVELLLERVDALERKLSESS